MALGLLSEVELAGLQAKMRGLTPDDPDALLAFRTEVIMMLRELAIASETIIDARNAGGTADGS